MKTQRQSTPREESHSGPLRDRTQPCWLIYMSWILNLTTSIWEKEIKRLSIRIASPHRAGRAAELQEQNQSNERQVGAGEHWRGLQDVDAPHHAFLSLCPRQPQAITRCAFHLAFICFLFDGCDNTSGKRLLVMASLCIEIRFMNESEPVILLGEKPSYGNRNPEPVLCCYPSRVDKQ